MENVLHRAAQVMRERGWQRGGADSTVCIMGAVAVARGMEAENWVAAVWHPAPDGSETNDETLENRLVREVIIEQYPELGNEIYGDTMDKPDFTFAWNDTFCTGGEEAAQILEKAAAKLEELR